MNTRLLAGSVAGLVLVFSAACGGGGPAPGASNAPPPAATRAAGVGSDCVKEAVDGATVIEVTTNQFPAETTVAAGETITWTNNDPQRTHTVTFRGGPNCNHILIGASASIQFDFAGTYDYVCQFHEVMSGKVIVQ